MDDTHAPDDRDLLAAARLGDPPAFERLVARHRGELYAHCYRMLGSVHDAEDAMQESLLDAWRGLAGFEGRSSLRAWLYRVTTNACLRLIRRRPPRMRSPDHGPAISRLDNAIEKVVVSDSLTADETDPWRDSTRIVRRADAHRAIADLKQRDGKDILMFGSHTLWNDLLDHGLVDEVHLIVGAVILGGGTPAFENPPPGPLRRIEVRALEGSDNVLARYGVVREGT